MYTWVYEVHHVCTGTCEGYEKMLDPMELELQRVVGHYVGAENQAWVLSLLDLFSVSI